MCQMTVQALQVLFLLTKCLFFPAVFQLEEIQTDVVSHHSFQRNYCSDLGTNGVESRYICAIKQGKLQ